MESTKISFGFFMVVALLLNDVIKVNGAEEKSDKATGTPTTDSKSKAKPKETKKSAPPSPPEKKKEDTSPTPPEEKKEPSTSPPEQNKEPPPSPTAEKKEPPPEEKKDSPAEEKKEPPREEKKDPPPEEKKEPPPSPPEEKKKDSPPSSTAEINKVTPPSSPPPSSNSPATFDPKSNSYLSKGIKMVAGKGMVAKVLVVAQFEPLPTDLTGKSDEELKKYINILVEEREVIELRFIYHMSLTLLVGIAAWGLQPYAAVLPVLTAAADHEDSFSSSLTAQWEQHQERLAAFIVEYMRVKNIDPSTLGKNTQGVTSLKVERSPNTFVTLPVWRTQKGAALPPESMKIRESSKNLLQNWWNQK